MPFTPAHAVVALPFIRTAFVPAAIAVAAMSPDLPLFFGVIPYSVTHHPIAGPLVGVPIALVLLLVWRLLLRPAVPQLVPRWFAQRLPEQWSSPLAGWWTLWGGRAASTGRRWAAAGMLVVSLIIGIATHILWDSFTHSGRWDSALLPWLRGSFLGQEWTDWLQHASSLLGLAILGLWGWRWLRRRASHPSPRVVPVWFVLAIWLAMPAILVVTTLVTVLAGHRELRSVAFVAGTAGGAAILVLLAVSSTVILVLRARHARDAGAFGVGDPDT